MNNRPYIYKTDRPEYEFGYLEWKPEVERPFCINTYNKESYCTEDAEDCECFKYEGDQHSIERSRVPVSEELYARIFNTGIAQALQLYEGHDFTLSGGVAVPVKENKIKVLLVEDSSMHHFKYGDLKNLNSELSRLQSENEKLKEEISKAFDAGANSMLQRVFIGSFSDFLKTPEILYSQTGVDADKKKYLETLKTL